MRCEQCEFHGQIVTEGVELESSRTQYHHELCQHEDCLACPEVRTECYWARNPNKPIALCRPCADEHHLNWDEQWASYYAGLM